jgi:hypothetical protein
MLFALHLSYLASYASAAAEKGKVSSSMNKSDIRSVPQALQAAFSDAVGHDDPAYVIRRTAEGYHGSNTRHNLLMEFSSSGINIRTGISQWGLRLKKIGYGNELHAVALTAPKVAANRVEYLYGGMTEWYINGPLGLEQGFTINHAPADQRTGGPLTLELSSSGDLSPTIDSAGTGLLLTGRGGKQILRYGGLKAVDATGRQLQTWLQSDGLRLLVHVDDSEARYPVVVDPLIQRQELTASDAAVGDGFGSVALSADDSTALIGAPDKNSLKGEAYVFTRSGSAWSQLQKLAASDGAIDDEFGWSMALSADGGTALIGAPFKNSQGVVYVFTRSGSTWLQLQELTAPVGATSFGWSVALSADGSTALIGAPSNTSQTDAYVFTLSGSTWSQQQVLEASVIVANYNFGLSVALSADGSTALIGAASTVGNPFSGAAYVFTRSGTTWSLLQELTASDAAAGDVFGASVALSADGDTALIGAPFKNSQGVAYVFTLSGSTWSQLQELTASDGAIGDEFGFSVALSADGSTAVSSAPFKNRFQGAAYVFTPSGSTWSQKQELTASDGVTYDFFAQYVALSSDGGTAFIGAPQHNFTGTVYVFNEGSIPPSLLNHLSAYVQILFGVTNDGGGDVILPGGAIIHIPPGGPGDPLFGTLSENMPAVLQAVALYESTLVSTSASTNSSIQQQRRRALLMAIEALGKMEVSLGEALLSGR